MARLGDYIEITDVRNSNRSITKLLGISSSKQFRESTSNMVGVDIDNYKVVERNTFAYDPINTIRVDRVPIALNEADPIIISPAYITFRVKDESKLIPKYLFLVFSTPCFDKVGLFHALIGVRGSIDMEDFLNIEISIPEIFEQRKIVNKYQTIEKCIENNNSMIKNLDNITQAIFYHFFEENIDTENLPDGWRHGKIGEILEVCYGKDHKYISDGNVPIYGSGGIMRYGDSIMYDKDSVLIPRKGSLNNVMYVNEPFWTVDTMFYTKPKMQNIMRYAYQIISKIDFLSMDTGSAVPSMTTKEIASIDIIIPNSSILVDYDLRISKIFKYKSLLVNEVKILEELRNNILSTI